MCVFSFFAARFTRESGYVGTGVFSSPSDDDDDARPRLTVRPTARVHREKLHVNHQPFRVTARDAPRADPHGGEAEGPTTTTTACQPVRARPPRARHSSRCATSLPSLRRGSRASEPRRPRRRDAPGPSSMDWLMHQHDLMGHGPGGHDIMEAHAGGDDPLSSLLHMEQEGQGNNSDFGGLEMTCSPSNPQTRAGSSRPARTRGAAVREAARTTRTRAGTARTKARTHQGTRGRATARTTRASEEKTSGSGPVGDVGEMETTLTRPFATSALRQAQLQRYRAKRLARHLGHKKIRYECRKTLADNRPRIKGRFAKVLPEGMATAQSCPDLPSLGKRAQSEEPTKQSSEDSTGGVATTKGRRSRLSGGSDANSGLVKGKGREGCRGEEGKGEARLGRVRADCGDERRAGAPAEQHAWRLAVHAGEVSLAQLDRTGRW